MDCGANGRKHKEYMRAYINKVRRIVATAGKPGPKKKESLNLIGETRIDSAELPFWLSALSTDLLDAPLRAVYEQIVTSCELSETELVVLKLVALDFTDEEIRVLMGAKREDYARGVMSRIKKRANFEGSIRKTFKKLNRGE